MGSFWSLLGSLWGFLGSLLILLGPLWGRRGFILGSKNGFEHQQCPKSRQRGATTFSHSPFWRPFSTPNRSKLDPRWVSRGMPKTITKKYRFKGILGRLFIPEPRKSCQKRCTVAQNREYHLSPAKPIFPENGTNFGSILRAEIGPKV